MLDSYDAKSTATMIVLYTVHCIAEIRALKHPRVRGPRQLAFLRSADFLGCWRGPSSLVPSLSRLQGRDDLPKASDRWCA
jgi:hypothetical protein